MFVVVPEHLKGTMLSVAVAGVAAGVENGNILMALAARILHERIQENGILDAKDCEILKLLMEPAMEDLAEEEKLSGQDKQDIQGVYDLICKIA